MRRGGLGFPRSRAWRVQVGWGGGAMLRRILPRGRADMRCYRSGPSAPAALTSVSVILELVAQRRNDHFDLADDLE